jgi:hypothetical protein
MSETSVVYMICSVPLAAAIWPSGMIPQKLPPVANRNKDIMNLCRYTSTTLHVSVHSLHPSWS